MIKHLANIPQEMTQYNQWVNWVSKESRGRPVKIPIHPYEDRYAKVNDPGTWGTFEDVVAKALASDKKQLGIGFVFTDTDPFIGIDLDKCVGWISGEPIPSPYATKILTLLRSYTEISPSGHGLHIIVKGNIDLHWNKMDGVEIYTTLRYFTITGRVLCAKPIRDCTKELRKLNSALWAL